MRELVGRATLLVGIVLAGSANADAPRDPRAVEAEACFEAAEAAQPLMKRRKLRDAQKKLAVCAREVCPKAARADCETWLGDVMRALPTIILVAREEHGGAMSVADGARVSIDGGEIVVARLDGSPVALDPGAHVVRFERDGFDAIETKIELREGDKDQRIEVVFRARAPQAPAPASSIDADTKPTRVDTPPPTSVEAPVRGDPTTAYLLAGIGVVGLGIGGYFEAKGLSDRARLVDSCKPARSCAPSDVDAARGRVIVGDVMLGASAVVIATAAYLYLTRNSAPREPRAGRLFVDVHTLPGGVALGVAGRMW